jgi:hypothetical protein
MRLIRSLVGMVVLAVAFNACFKAPEFPVIPEITFNDIVFKDVPGSASADTLILTINFKDGDGDLGLGDAETDYISDGGQAYPVMDKLYFKLDGTPVYFPAGSTVANDGSLMSYKTKRTKNDTLPAFITPYNCANWEVLTDGTTGKATDTLYFQLNPNHYNIFVDFYIKQQDNSFALFDWKKEFIYPNCQVNGFYGRFPILSKDLSQNTAQEGTIRYSMKSVGFLIFFSIKVLKLKISIQDRKLQRSNIIESPEFTLQSIRK